MSDRFVVYSPEERARFRIQFLRTGLRAIDTGKPLDGVAISGKALVTLRSGERVIGYDLGLSHHGKLRGHRIVDARTGVLYLFDENEIVSLGYYDDRRAPFGPGHHLQADRAMHRRGG